MRFTYQFTWCWVVLLSKTVNIKDQDTGAMLFILSVFSVVPIVIVFF